MAYLITCAGSKRTPVYNPSHIENLSFSERLQDARNLMIETAGINLNWNCTLPAWKLYSGTYSRLYPHVEEHNWTKPTIEIKILSALFGWIKHTDLVPYYDLRMDHRIGNNQLVSRMWLNQGVLLGLVHANDIDLLSIKYRKAINRRGLPVALLPDVEFPRDRGDAKGVWLNDQLENTPN